MATEIGRGRAIVQKVVPRPLRRHVLLTAVVAGVLVGGGLRFVPTSSASESAGEDAPASTACAAQ
jgi:hypothetical protein